MDGSSNDMEDISPGIRARPQERLLIDALTSFSPARVLCTSQGLGQIALTAAERSPLAAVHCHFLDLYRAELARKFLDAASPHLATASRRWRPNPLPKGEGAGFSIGTNLTIECSADFPACEVDLAAIALSAQGEAELAREQLQDAHQRLALGGHLLTSTDNARDTWLHEEMQKLFAKVERRPSTAGVVYIAEKAAPLKRVRNFSAEFAFRDAGRLIHACSRPGVFSHRKLDPGARQVLNAMEVRPGDRVLDLGCGGGALALAAAFRAENVQVLAVDSHARAVECTARGAALNGLTNVAVELSATGPTIGVGTFDLVLANPPYYTNFRIARFMVETARAALKPGGTLIVVTKQPAWYDENLPPLFRAVEIEPSKAYWIVRAAR